MSDLGTYTIPHDIKFSDIIVPTMDTVSCSAIMQMLLTNNNQVSHH